MKRLLLLLLAFISLNATAQKDYFSNKAQFGTIQASSATDKLGTFDAQGYLNKSTISVQDLIDGLSPDLSNYVTKDLPENIIGEKTFMKDASGGGVRINNNSNITALDIFNYLNGVGTYVQNGAGGVAHYVNNNLDGKSIVLDNNFVSTGESLVVVKEVSTGVDKEVFAIDNVGNTLLQELEIEQASENTVSDEVLVRGADNKVGYVSKASLGGGSSGAIVKDGAGYIIADRTDGANHGTVGAGAFDLSYNTTLQSAIGAYSFASGYNVDVGAYGIGGGQNVTVGDNGIGGGTGVNVGDYGIGGGQNVTVGDNGIGGGTGVNVGDYGIGGGINVNVGYTGIGGGKNVTVGNYGIGGGSSVTVGDNGIGGGTGVNVGYAGIGGGRDVNVGTYGLGSGSGISAPSYGETAHGSYNTTYTPQSTTAFDFNINDRLFSLGNGTDANNRSNAVEVWKDGRTILDKLEIRTLDEDNTATKVLVADDNGKVGYKDKVDYLPLTGGVVTGDVTVKDGRLFLDNGTTSRYGFAADNPGMFIYDYTGGMIAMRLFHNKNVEFYGVTSSADGFKVGADDVYHEGNQTINNWVVYGNSGATQTASANVPTIINNNAGNINNNGNITSLYNTSTQRVNLTQARVGDSLNITMEVEVTTNSNNQVVYMTYTGSQGTSNEWTVNLTNEVNYKNQGTRKMVCSFKVPLEFATDISAPGAIRVVSDGTLNFKANYHSLTIN